MSNFKKRLAGVIAAATAAICLSGTMVGAVLKEVNWGYTDSNNVRHYQASYRGDFIGYHVEKIGENVNNQTTSDFYAHHYYGISAVGQHDFLTIIRNQTSGNRYVDMSPKLYNDDTNTLVKQSSNGGVISNDPDDKLMCTIFAMNSQVPERFKAVYTCSIYTSSSSYSPVATRYTFTEYGERP